MCLYVGFVSNYWKTIKGSIKRVSLLVTMQAQACNFIISNTPQWFFSRLLNCNRGTKSRRASHMSPGETKYGRVFYKCLVRFRGNTGVNDLTFEVFIY